MLPKAVLVLFLVIFVQGQNTPSAEDLRKDPLFNKFFEEFKKQYQELKTEQGARTEPSTISNQPTTTYFSPTEPSTISQTSLRPHIRRPAERPVIDTTSFQHITPSRRIKCPKEDSPLRKFVARVREEDPTNGFLSFVQSALAAPTKRPPIPLSDTNTNLARKLVKIVPRLKEELPSEPSTESLLIPQNPRKQTPRKKLRPEDKFDEEEFRKQAESAKYNFASDVKDDINGNVHQRQEIREGNKVKGMYSYEDGFFKRTVHYEADEKGYRVVKEEVQEIGDGPLINPNGSAKVESYVAGKTLNYQITNRDIISRKPIQYKGIEDPEFTRPSKNYQITNRDQTRRLPNTYRGFENPDYQYADY
ncbi:hypothetical protein HHI36_021819 [Cryptolaemus montrouzieri]|uniref:Uncharacterized protein n=1 Tax=Cryptolaemus montrouzieri TaxID=559131 RepID=A0ABD2MYT5_9CUCU